jgi:hypothetical protein
MPRSDGVPTESPHPAREERQEEEVKVSSETKGAALEAALQVCMVPPMLLADWGNEGGQVVPTLLLQHWWGQGGGPGGDSFLLTGQTRDSQLP